MRPFRTRSFPERIFPAPSQTNYPTSTPMRSLPPCDIPFLGGCKSRINPSYSRSTDIPFTDSAAYQRSGRKAGALSAMLVAARSHERSLNLYFFFVARVMYRCHVTSLCFPIETRGSHATRSNFLQTYFPLSPLANLQASVLQILPTTRYVRRVSLLSLPSPPLPSNLLYDDDIPCNLP